MVAVTGFRGKTNLVTLGWWFTVIVPLAIGLASLWVMFPEGQTEQVFSRPDLLGLQVERLENVTFPTAGITLERSPEQFEALGLQPRIAVLSQGADRVSHIKIADASPGDRVDYYRTEETIFHISFGRIINGAEAFADEGIITVRTDRSFTNDPWEGADWLPLGNYILLAVAVLVIIIVARAMYRNFIRGR